MMEYFKKRLALIRKYKSKHYEDMTQAERAEYDQTVHEINEMGIGGRVQRFFNEYAGVFMRKSEEWARKMAFSVGYKQAERMGFSEAQAIEYAKKFTVQTQFAYNNAARIDRDRSATGRILSRFKQYGYEAFRENRRIWDSAQKAGWDPNNMGTQSAGRYIGIIMMLLALGEALPYSLFDLAQQPHIQNTTELAKMVFDGQDRGDYFFNTYGLSTFTSPTTGIALVPLQLWSMSMSADPDYRNFLKRQSMYQMPFGRMIYNGQKLLDNGIAGLPDELGIPLKGIQINDRKRRQWEKQNTIAV